MTSDDNHPGAQGKLALRARVHIPGSFRAGPGRHDSMVRGIHEQGNAIFAHLLPGSGNQSHRNVRAARAIAPAAQTASVTVFPTGNATPYCRTSRRPVDSAPVGSSSSTGRAVAGNLVSGNTTPPKPSSRM